MARSRGGDLPGRPERLGGHGCRVASVLWGVVLVLAAGVLGSGLASPWAAGAPVSTPTPTSSTSAATATPGGGSTSTTASGSTDGWVVSWGSAMAWWPPWAIATDTTVRQVVPLSVGGTSLRVQISNRFGAAPLAIGAATVGLQQSGPALVPGTLHSLTFSGQPSVRVPPGGAVYSDPLSFPVQAAQVLEVSVWASGTNHVTQHYDAGPLSYAGANGSGNLTGVVSGAGLGYAETWGRWVSAVDVAGGSTTGSATVVLGDSISDGYAPSCGGGSMCDVTTPWPDVLDQRVQSLDQGSRVSVADESITANTLIPIETPLAIQYRNGGGGPAGLDRLAQDALDQPGIDRLIVLLGTNDLWFGATADQVIAGYQTILAQADAAHVGVIGVTLLPRAGSEQWTPQMEQYRQQVNDWILNSGQFPVVVDLAAVMANVYNGACNTSQMFPPYDSGDHLHPNNAGQVAMANAIPTTLLGAATAATVKPLVAVTPTPGCPQAQVVKVNHPFPASAVTTPPTTTPTTSSTTPASTVGSSKDASPGPLSSTGAKVGLGAAALALAILIGVVARQWSRRSRRGRHFRPR